MKFNCAATAAACLLAWSFTSNSSAEEPKPAPVTPPKAPLEEPKADPKADRYALPANATAAALVEFCKKLQGLEPKSKEEEAEMQAKIPGALKQACAEIL